jgi:hypothetical protein
MAARARRDHDGLDGALGDLLRGIRREQTHAMHEEAAKRGTNARLHGSASGTGKFTMHQRYLAHCLGFGTDSMATHFLCEFWASEMPEEHERAYTAAIVLRFKTSGRLASEDEEASVWSAIFHDQRGVHEGSFGIGYLQCRTCYFDAVVSAHAEMAQLVVLGAGFDTRCYRLERRPARCFEVDAPTTQAEKREALARAHIDARHVSFVAVDFAVHDWMALLIDAGFDPAQPTLFLWEATPAPCLTVAHEPPAREAAPLNVLVLRRRE